MATLEWTPALVLDLPLMDSGNQEFVALLAEVEAGPDAALPLAWDRLLRHAQALFDQEDHWMRATAFASASCHSLQHKVVLQVMREGGLRASRGDAASLRHMAAELGDWFSRHTQTMGAALALHLRRVDWSSAALQPPKVCDGGCAGRGQACSRQQAGRAFAD